MVSVVRFAARIVTKELQPAEALVGDSVCRMVQLHKLTGFHELSTPHALNHVGLSGVFQHINGKLLLPVPL